MYEAWELECPSSDSGSATVQTWASHLISQNLSVLICEMGILGGDQLENRVSLGFGKSLIARIV